MGRSSSLVRRRRFNNADLMGLIFAAAVLAVLLLGILSADRLGTIDNGRYAQTMQAAGLEYLPEDLENPDTLQYDHVIERYGYGSFSYWKLLAPSGECSVIYPIAVVRLLTQPFGIPFSTQYLAIVYALLFAAGTYILVKSCCFLGGWVGAIPGAFLFLAAADRNLTAYFNSLYNVGMTVVGLLLLAASSMRMFTYGKTRPGGSLTLFLLAAVLCLNSSVLSVLFAPAAVLIGLAALTAAVRAERIRLKSAFGVILILAAAVFSSVQYQNESPDIQSDASVYHSAFIGFLEASDDPKADLAEFGLDESYLADIGKTYYYPAEAYRHCPWEDSALFEKLTRSSVRSFFLRHPVRLIQTARRQTEQYNHFESSVVSRAAGDGQTEHVWSAADTLMKMLLPGEYTAVALLVPELAAAVWLAVRLWRKGKLISLLAALAAICYGAGSIFFVPMHLRYMGREFLASARIVGVFGALVGISGVCVAAGDFIRVTSEWFRAGQEDPRVLYRLTDWQGCLSPSAGRRFPLAAIAQSRAAGTFLVFLLAFSMSAIIQLLPMRAGCVNNGDYGRMMEQLGLNWQDTILHQVDAQANHFVIENYAYRSGFDWRALTSLSPKYSLIYPASLVRLICFFTGQTFSTWYMSMIMNAVLVACIVSITYDLYGMYGSGAALFGSLLCGVFLCEGYLVWFNSLFGEGCILLGAFMVIACCVHLAVNPERKCWLSVLLLLFSARFLLCAKAQMLVALPVVMALIAAFSILHRPRAAMGRAIYAAAVLVGCALICVDCVMVYRDDAKISRRQTVWQSTFFGALMISDDPEDAMEELGIDKRMLPDIGKDAYHSDEDYVISPNSPEADAAFFDHVNTLTMVGYYLRHPGQLWRMLNHAASTSQTMYTGFRAYLGQDYAQPHDQVQRFGLWELWRNFFTFGSFVSYVLLYGALIALCVFGVLRRKEADIRRKMLAVIYLGILLIGAVQYPLSVIGNGFADNHKQMFGFMLCHDILTLVNLTVGFRFLGRHGPELLAKLRLSRRPMREQVHM